MDRIYLPQDTVVGGAYCIKRMLGAGGFGVTYAAEDTTLRSIVAIKEYYPEEFSTRDDKDFTIGPKRARDAETYEWGRRSFLEEARTLVRFRHPSIVQVTRVFEERGTVYMVMAFEDGPSFEKWLRQLGRPPTQAELDKIVWHLLDALEHLHAQHFIHRDIAPDNVIVRADGTPVLLDFGAARRTIADKTNTLTGLIKPGYSPQEQYAADARLQGPWTDLYALGATLYRAVSGASPEEATIRVNDDTIRPATSLPNAGLYRKTFLEGIDACLRTVPRQRPQSVDRARVLLCDQPGTRLTRFPTRIIAATRTIRSPRLVLGIVVASVVTLMGGYGAYRYAESVRLAELEHKRKLEADAAEKQRAEEKKRREAAAKSKADQDRQKQETLNACVAFSGETLNELNSHKVVRGQITNDLISPPKRVGQTISAEGVSWCVTGEGVRYAERQQQTVDAMFPFGTDVDRSVKLLESNAKMTNSATQIRGRADRVGKTISVLSRFKTATQYHDTNADGWNEFLIDFTIELVGNDCRVLKYERSSDRYLDSKAAYNAVQRTGMTGGFEKSRTISSSVRCFVVPNRP